jgi:hypothetical protein
VLLVKVATAVAAAVVMAVVGEETVEEEDAEVVVDAVADGDLLLFNAYNAKVLRSLGYKLVHSLRL